MDSKKWNLIVLGGTGGLLLLLAVVTIVIDPFLHFHKPLEGLEYPMKDERYLNDGIARWFDYDAIITGTSMTQNFKVSEWNEKMGVNAIKTSYSGASFHEITESLRRAFSYNPDVKIVLCSLDSSRIMYPADKDEYEGYPEYLYNANPFDDVEYVLNKEVMPKTLAVINYTRAGEKTPSMDVYGSWSQYHTFGRDAVAKTMAQLPEISEEVVLSEEELAMARENVEKNWLELVKQNPSTEFYLFFPPYSIAYWDALHHTKQMDVHIQLELLATEIMLQAENVHLYAFWDWMDVIGNLDNYMDSMHYSEEINSKIIDAIASTESELTKENYKAYYEGIRELYSNYDYDAVWE
ncbi:MAG: hypothetical protein IJZ82_04180 [Lachnospiraceae bacterium]|nr:hypothetical protein [Lachnospiraceae bacterium]